MKVIGFTGKMQHGKTTAGIAASELFNSFLVSKRPFAESLKEMAIAIGWNGLKDEKGRRLLQLLGTEIGRQCIDYNMWVDKWCEKIEQDVANGKEIIVVDDVRFDNEAKAVKELDGIIIEVYRPTKKKWLISRIFDFIFSSKEHESEQSINHAYVDVVVTNDKSIKEFKQDIKDIINEWLI